MQNCCFGKWGKGGLDAWRNKAGVQSGKGSQMFTNKMSSRFEGVLGEVLLEVLMGSSGIRG